MLQNEQSLLDFLVSALSSKSKSRILIDDDDPFTLSVRIPSTVKLRLDALKENSNLSASMIASLLIEHGISEVESRLIEMHKRLEMEEKEAPLEFDDVGKMQLERSAAAVAALKAMRG